MKLSIIGLGKLGAPMSAVMAHKGHTVIGVDINPRHVKAIQEGRAPVNEPHLAEMIEASRERLTATESYEEAILATDVTFMIVPTPSNSDGRFSMEFVLQAAQEIGAALRKKQSWHLVVLSSTVMPGSVGGELLPALCRHSGKRCPEDFGLCYNPEFIALGSVVRDMLRPDMILIGESDPKSGAILEELYSGVCEGNPRIQRMNYVNAELTKLSVNTFVATKISYANMLAQICETLPEADADVVTAALGCDTRIGPKYLKGALGYGGPCFPRDNVALSALARENGVPALLAEATDDLNRRQVPRLTELVLSHLPEGGIAGVLGLSYKPNTEVIEESQGIAIAQALLATGARVVVYDPAAMENAKRVLTGDVVFAASAGECVRRADVLAITTPWAEFQELPTAAFQRRRGRLTVLDCWRVLPERVAGAIGNYLTLGKGGKPGYFSVAAGLEKLPERSIDPPIEGAGWSGYNQVVLSSIMTSATGTITQVHDYWNARPCNIRHSTKPVGSREYFDEVEARKYLVESHIPGFADFKRWQGKKVLEIGCGLGTDTINFARHGAQVTAVDLTEKSLELARQRARVFGLEERIRFIQANAEELSATVPVEPYDLVYSFGVIHHTPNPGKVLDEIRKYVTPESTVKIMVYNRWSWKVLWILFVYGKGQFWKLNGLIAEYSEAQTGCPVTYSYSRAGGRRWLAQHGFRTTDATVNHIFPYRIADYVQYRYKVLWYFRWMPKSMFRTLERALGWHLCLTAKAE